MKNNEFGIKCKDKEQKTLLEELVTKDNCGSKIKLIKKVAGISHKNFAKTIGVSESTLRRLENRKNDPTEDFMNRLMALSYVGVMKYGKMSDSDKEKISEFVGTSGGVVAGVGGSIAAIGAAGVVGGFSAAGITSGLAAIGGGTMLAGIGVVAAIPVATGALGYGLVKGIKAICKANNLSSDEVNDRWELRRKSKDTDNTEKNKGEKQ